MEFKFGSGDLVGVNMKDGIFQVVKPVFFKDANKSPEVLAFNKILKNKYKEEKICARYYIREVFDKNGELNIKPATLYHENWIFPLSQKTKLYNLVKDKLDLPELKNIVFEPSLEFGFYCKFNDSAYICCNNLAFKEISKRFDEISGDVLDEKKVFKILKEFYKKNKIKSFNILKPQEYALEKDENVYVVEIGRFVDDFLVPDKCATKFYRIARLRKRPVKEIIKK